MPSFWYEADGDVDEWAAEWWGDAESHAAASEAGTSEGQGDAPLETSPLLVSSFLDGNEKGWWLLDSGASVSVLAECHALQYDVTDEQSFSRTFSAMNKLGKVWVDIHMDKNGNNRNKAGTRTHKLDKNGNKVGTKWDKNGNKVGAKWEQEPQSGTRMGTKPEESGNKFPKVGQEWETKWAQEPQSGRRMGTKWERSGKKNPKVGQDWEKSGNKVGTRTPKWDKNGNKVVTKLEQEPQSGTRMGTKWEQSGNKNPKVGQEWEQSGNKNPKVG